ncbi:MAG: T9SS C-terminal target domain-containing protein, partial [Chitinophagia bacterium]|nr:T9SS C-terminal target domain-containing protein [Chitinophagia bacterium]
LSAFSVAQGQHTDSVCRYSFYRKGSFSYLMSFYYGSDNTYTTAREVYQNTDNITPLSIDETAAGSFSTVIFPNPSNGTSINLLVNGKDLNATQYTVIDVTGKTIQTGAANVRNNELHVDLNNLSNGTYVLMVTGNNGVVAKETFTVAK